MSKKGTLKSEFIYQYNTEIKKNLTFSLMLLRYSRKKPNNFFFVNVKTKGLKECWKILFHWGIVLNNSNAMFCALSKNLRTERREYII